MAHHFSLKLAQGLIVTVLHMQLLLHAEVVEASIDTRVLVASISTSVDGTSYNLNLPLGSPAQKLPLKLDVQTSVTSLHCSTNTSDPNTLHTSLSSTFQYCSSREFVNSCLCAQDTVSLYIERTAFSDPLLWANVSAVDFTCCPQLHTIGTAGTAGFANGHLALPVQITQNAGLARRFSYCLPSVAFFGHVTTYAMLNAPVGHMETFSPPSPLPWTLHFLKKGAGYAVGLLNISVGAFGTRFRRRISLRISTTQVYTTLKTSIYNQFRQCFRQAIGYGKTVAAFPSIPPFDTCFDVAPLYIPPGPFLQQPVVSFEMEGGGSWILYPRTTLAFPNGSSSSAACLAFLDAGPSKPSVLGSFQQTDSLLQFDLQNSSIGISQIFNPYGIHPEAPQCSAILYPMYPQ